MKTVSVFPIAGDFAENKDAARMIREAELAPTLQQGQHLAIDFTGVELATQSFIHALLSDLIRSLGSDVLDMLVFKGCNDNIRGLVSIVVEYSQDSTHDDGDISSENSSNL